MLLLDTHTFVWLASDRTQLPEKMLELMEVDSDDLFISSIPATAPAHGMTILTRNRTIPAYPKVKVVWE